MTVSIIAAVSQNGVIGKDNKIPWHIKEDMKWFKENTKGKPIIMGRKTYESIGKKLPGRLNVVISRNALYECEDPDIVVYRSLQDAFSDLAGFKEIIVIGGSEIYKEALPFVSTIYLTRIMRDFDGDAYFPDFDENRYNVVFERESSEENLKYKFMILET